MQHLDAADSTGTQPCVILVLQRVLANTTRAQFDTYITRVHMSD